MRICLSARFVLRNCEDVGLSRSNALERGAALCGGLVG